MPLCDTFLYAYIYILRNISFLLLSYNGRFNYHLNFVSGSFVVNTMIVFIVEIADGGWCMCFVRRSRLALLFCGSMRSFDATCLSCYGHLFEMVCVTA